MANVDHSDAEKEEDIQNAIVDRLTQFLQLGPSDFEITILSFPPQGEEQEETLASVEVSIVLVKSTHLGMDATSLPWITRYLRQAYKKCKKQQHEERSGAACDQWHQQLWKITSCLLLVNPDHPTVWADRRRAMLKMGGNGTNKTLWYDELKYLDLLMTQHSKA
jgi:hypothetical protein